MEKIKNKFWRGSFTVEASIIILLIITVIIMVLSIGIYFHEINILVNSVNEGALYAEKLLNEVSILNNISDYSLYDSKIMEAYVENKTNEYIYSICLDRLIDNEKLSEVMIMSTQIENEIYYYNVEISVTKTTEKFFYSLIANLLAKDSEGVYVNQNNKIYIKEDVVRNVNLINDLSDDILEIREVKENYHNKTDELEIKLKEIFE